MCLGLLHLQHQLTHRSEIARHKKRRPRFRLHLHRRRSQRLYLAIRHPCSPSSLRSLGGLNVRSRCRRTTLSEYFSDVSGTGDEHDVSHVHVSEAD